MIVRAALVACRAGCDAGCRRYKAEVDIDGRQMAEAFLAKQNQEEIIAQFQAATPEQGEVRFSVLLYCFI